MALSGGAESRPRVLLVHNAYQQRGGEDSVVDAELALLRDAGHPVETYFRHNDEVAAMSAPALLANTLWSRRSVDDLLGLAQRFRPDVIHVHNTHPLISPSAFWAAGRLRVPVIQTLHNFRLLCPQGMLLRDEKVCEDCLGHLPWRAVWHRCYRRSAAQSAVVAATVTLHRAAGTWRHKVSRYIALNRFCRDKFVQGGLPAERLRIKPNFVDVPAPELGLPRSGGLFVGRLSVEKGVAVLARALALEPDVALSVVGAGELEPELRAVASARVLGFLALPQILALMQRASWLVVPSIWYENFPRTIVEAYACGLPVIASRIGALPELVEEGWTGLLFEPGSAEDLARKLHWAHTHPQEMARMGAQARARYEAMYTPAHNLAMLNEIYAEAIDAERSRA